MNCFSRTPGAPFFMLAATAALASPEGVSAGPAAAAHALDGSPLPALIERYCMDCHNSERKKGKVDLESAAAGDFGQHRATWEDVAWMLREREMPPVDEPDLERPDDEQYASAAAWLDRKLDALAAAQPDAARTPPAIAAKHAVINKYCASCHGSEKQESDLSLEAIASDPVTAHPHIWEDVVRRLETRQMPPAGRKKPAEETYQALIASLSDTLDEAAAKNPNPGRTETFRRLNRTEYQNAIRDLLALEIDAAAFLPRDDESHGFDNVTVAELSPTLLDRYITAAQKISRLAVGTPSRAPTGDTVRIKPDVTQEKHIEGLPIGTRGGTLIEYTFPRDGDYEVRVRLTRDRNEHVEGLREPHEMEVLLDRARMASFTILPPKNAGEHETADQHLAARISVKAGPHALGVTFPKHNPSILAETLRQPFESRFNMHRHPRLSPAIYQVTITGPYHDAGISETPSRRRIFTSMPARTADEDACAERILAPILRRAYRRPVTDEDLARPMDFFRAARDEGGFEPGIEMALSAVLVSPQFLFRIEREPENIAAGSPYRVTDLDLATRLSFFLWSSIPDDELLDAAEQGDLSDSGKLSDQVMRMLADPRAHNLATNFAGQWLYLRNLESFTPDLRLFPDFDDNLRQALRQETELFFESVIRGDRSVSDLIGADYTFLNERLAKHYGIPNIYGSHFRRVKLKDEWQRGGLLRQGSILAVTSYANRTSPVIRGHWVLKNLVGTPPPPPPPDIPALESNDVDQSLPMRERLAAHASNSACASCHVLMDPVGFSLENFDAVGRWRTTEDGRPVDASGGSPDGRKFDGVAGLEEALLDWPEVFARTLAEKLLTFALGRGVEHYDGPALRAIVRRAKEDDFRFSAIILGIVESTPFQMRKSSS